MDPEFSLDNPLLFPDHGETTLAALLAAESDHAPAISCSDAALSHRQDVASLILKAAEPPCSVDRSLTYLAINYADRYLSSLVILKKDPFWIEAILAMACLTLAAKMLSQAFSVAEFQVFLRHLHLPVQIDLGEIDRMETAVISTLHWRMRSITPFAFLDCLLSYFPSEDQHFVRDLKKEASETLFQAQIAFGFSPIPPLPPDEQTELPSPHSIFWRTDIKLLGFRPSVTAAAALLAATSKLFPAEFLAFEETISSSTSLDQEKVRKCFEIIQDMKMNGGDSSSEGRTDRG